MGGLTPATLADKNTNSAEGLNMGVVIQGVAGGFKPAIIHELENQINKERSIPIQLKSLSDLEDFSRSKFLCFFQFSRLK